MPSFFNSPFSRRRTRHGSINPFASVTYNFRQIPRISDKSLYFHTHRGIHRHLPGVKAPIPALQKAPRLIQEGRRMSAGGGYPPPTDAALLTSISLARRQDTLSIGKSANFLPVGKDFTIPARNFLPVGKPGLQASDFQLTGRTLTSAGAA